jgi:hypothetical protein
VFAITTKEGNPEEILLRANNISHRVKFTLEKEKGWLPPFPGCTYYTTRREINNISIHEENRFWEVPSL